MSKHTPGLKDEYATEADTAEPLQASKLPEPLRLADGLEKTMVWPLHGKAADCLRKLHGELEAMKAVQQEQVAFYVYEWLNPSEGTVFRSFRADEHQFGRGPDRTIAVPTPPAQPSPAPSSWVETVAVNLVREGINKHKARELAAHFHGLAHQPSAQPAPGQEPVLQEIEQYRLQLSGPARPAQTFSPNQDACKTERMREVLRRQDWASSDQLKHEAGLPDASRVGALLKGDLARGSVRRVADGYRWCKEWDDQTQAQLSAAAALLLRHGYTVTLPAPAK